MPAALNLEEACAILGEDILGPRETERVFGVVAGTEPPLIPFTRTELANARTAGETLVLRVAQAGDGGPLTILQMVQRFPDAFDKRYLRQMGYQLKDEWGIELEPLAAKDTCTTGWALARKQILDNTRNLTYDEQEAVIHQYAATLGVERTALRRRTAVEAVYDSLLYLAARQVRLLEKTWDWSGSRTVDGGYLNVGGFGANGLQVLSFSGAVRHGGLGVCPTRQPLA